MTALVSVIIPAYNAEQFVGDAIQSALAQRHDPVEVIVIDDGSSDGTGEVAVRYPGVVLITQPNSGFGSSPRNLGFRRSSGEFVCFLDADDLLAPERTASQARFLRQHPSVGVVFSDYQNFDATGRWRMTHFDTCHRLRAELSGRRECVLEHPRRALAAEHFGITGSVMIRREVLGGLAKVWDETLRAGEDFDLFYRLAAVADVGVIDEVGMFRRLHSSNITRDSRRTLRSTIEVWSRFAATEVDRDARALLRKAVGESWAGLARLDANDGAYRSSFENALRGIVAAPTARQLRTTSWCLARTAAMALGMHRSTD